jgi:hypothetical protein
MEIPQYTINDLMKLLSLSEVGIRKLLVDAGIEIDESKSDPQEIIPYEDFRKLWISLANRPEGRLLATLLIEESGNWFDRMFGVNR